LIAAASNCLPRLVRLISSHTSPITAQEIAAVSTSFHGVRTPTMSTTPGSRGRTVFGLSVKK
jgi:hypothetical protein